MPDLYRRDHSVTFAPMSLSQSSMSPSTSCSGAPPCKRTNICCHPCKESQRFHDVHVHVMWRRLFPGDGLAWEVVTEGITSLQECCIYHQTVYQGTGTTVSYHKHCKLPWPLLVCMTTVSYHGHCWFAWTLLLFMNNFYEGSCCGNSIRLIATMPSS